jgi:hypothetical protein
MVCIRHWGMQVLRDQERHLSRAVPDFELLD